MAITPSDIQKKEFTTARFNGYSSEEVDSFLDEIAEELGRAQKENQAAREEVEKMRQKVDDFEEMQKTLQNALINAQKAADNIVNEAKSEAERALKEARGKSERMVEEAREQAERLQRESRESAESRLGDARRESERMLRDSEKRSREMLEEAKKGSTGIFERIEETRSSAREFIEAVRGLLDKNMMILDQMEGTVNEKLQFEEEVVPHPVKAEPEIALSDEIPDEQQPVENYAKAEEEAKEEEFASAQPPVFTIEESRNDLTAEAEPPEALNGFADKNQEAPVSVDISVSESANIIVENEAAAKETDIPAESEAAHEEEDALEDGGAEASLAEAQREAEPQLDTEAEETTERPPMIDEVLEKEETVAPPKFEEKLPEEETELKTDETKEQKKRFFWE